MPLIYICHMVFIVKFGAGKHTAIVLSIRASKQRSGIPLSFNKVKSNGINIAHIILHRFKYFKNTTVKSVFFFYHTQF